MVTVQERNERNERILRGESKYPVHMWLSQHNDQIWASTVKQLIERHNAIYNTKYRSAQKMYVDKKDGRTMHCGHILGQYWYRRFAPVEIEA